MSDQDLGASPEPEQSRPRRALPDDSAAWEDSTPTEEFAPVPDAAPQRGYPEDSAPPPTAPGAAAPPPGTSTQPAPEGPTPDWTRLVIGLIVVVLGIAVVVWLGLRDRGATAEPAPAASTSPVATPDEPTESPTEAQPTTAAPAQPAPIETLPVEEPTVEATTEAPVEEPSEEPEQVVPEDNPAPLTNDDLPQRLVGYALTDDLVYESDANAIFIMDMGIWVVDPNWEELTFPDAEPVAENASCSPDEGAGQGCIIMSGAHGVITASGDPGADITEFVLALAAHLR